MYEICKCKYVYRTKRSCEQEDLRRHILYYVILYLHVLYIHIINPVHTCRFLALNEINFPGTREAAGDEARLLQPPPGARHGGQINGNPPEEAGHCSVVMRKKQTVQQS
jgi:hypothetical protein